MGFNLITDPWIPIEDGVVPIMDALYEFRFSVPKRSQVSAPTLTPMVTEAAVELSDHLRRAGRGRRHPCCDARQRADRVSAKLP